jgi:hypothetical protein
MRITADGVMRHAAKAGWAARVLDSLPARVTAVRGIRIATCASFAML